MRRKLACRTAVGLLAATIAVMPAGVATAEQATMSSAEDLRRFEFKNNCAPCHGLDGTGNGPVAALFFKPPGSLTVLARNNDGKFPLERVYRIVDGRTEVPAHGTRTMPVWGDRFKAALEGVVDAGAQDLTRERLVRARILEIVYYLQSIQEE